MDFSPFFLTGAPKSGTTWLGKLLDDEDLESDLVDELEAEDEATSAPAAVDLALLKSEIAELDHYIDLASKVREDQKSHALLRALDQGFERMGQMGAAQLHRRNTRGACAGVASQTRRPGREPHFTACTANPCGMRFCGSSLTGICTLPRCWEIFCLNP